VLARFLVNWYTLVPSARYLCHTRSSIAKKKTGMSGRWRLHCHLDHTEDALVQATVALVRKFYGETEILEDAAAVMATEIAEGMFDTTHLLAAIRMGMPDPAAEGE